MEFRDATDELFSRISHDDLAAMLGVSVATIRQARLADDALAHRSPPAGWEGAVIRLAEERISHYRQLLQKMRERRK